MRPSSSTSCHVHVLLRLSLCSLKLVILLNPVRSTRLTSHLEGRWLPRMAHEQVLRALFWMLPDRVDRCICGSSMGHGTIDNLVVRTRTPCDHRRQLFQSLADANIEEDSGLDYDKEKRVPEERLRERIIMTMEMRFTMIFLTFFLALSLSKFMRLQSRGMPSVRLERIIIIPRSAYAG